MPSELEQRSSTAPQSNDKKSNPALVSFPRPDPYQLSSLASEICFEIEIANASFPSRDGSSPSPSLAPTPPASPPPTFLPLHLRPSHRSMFNSTPKHSMAPALDEPMSPLSPNASARKSPLKRAVLWRADSNLDMKDWDDWGFDLFSKDESELCSIGETVHGAMRQAVECDLPLRPPSLSQSLASSRSLTSSSASLSPSLPSRTSSSLSTPRTTTCRSTTSTTPSVCATRAT